LQNFEEQCCLQSYWLLGRNCGDQKDGDCLLSLCFVVFRCAGRLLLLFHHNENIIQSPSLPPLQRKKLVDDAHTEESRIRLHSASFTLKRSGRIIRSVNAGKHIRNILTLMFLKLKLSHTFFMFLVLNLRPNFKTQLETNYDHAY
jgi:hypothetical protein